MIIFYSFIYNVGNRKVYLVEQRQYILEKCNVTKDELAKYYKDYLRLSIYKSLMRRYLDEQKFEKTLIDSILLQGKTELINTNAKKKQEKGLRVQKNSINYIKRWMVKVEELLVHLSFININRMSDRKTKNTTHSFRWTSRYISG